MKFLIATALIMSAFTSTAFARSPKAAQYGNVAKASVVSMMGKKGDKVDLKLTQFESLQKEVWEVTLTNNASKGSAVYEVTVDIPQGDVVEGSEVATIKIKYLMGN